MYRMSWGAAVVALISLTSTPIASKAQNSQNSLDSAIYKKAQTLVNDGSGTAGRALVDSMIARATPGTNEYAEGLYWRAVLSATAAEAEMDYRRVIVDYPLSPRVEDVLLRLAQLELARADYDGALQHLNRLTLEHPNGPTRARAGYWTARVLFEKNDVQRACAVNADALTRTREQDAELWNQISYLNQRCAGVVIAATPTAGGARDSANVIKTDTLSTASPVTTPNVPVASAVTRKDTSAALPDAKPSARAITATPTAKVKQSNPVRKPVTSGTTETEIASGVAADNSTEEGGFSVQIAAYNVKSQAQAMATKLQKKGYQARVSGASAPFRVRIGHYTTHAQASAVMRSLKVKQIDGIVVKAEPR
jgi:cell division protein FtsN